MKTLDRMVGGDHYKDHFKIEPYEFISANKFDFATGNIIKYICRHPFKNGLEDLKKAVHNLEILMEQEYGYTEYKNKIRDKNNTIYISGPMSGLQENNFYEFYKAQYALEKKGWFVINPANLTFELAFLLNKDAKDLKYKELLDFDLEEMEVAGSIYFLIGWEKSAGAMKEYRKSTDLNLNQYYKMESVPDIT